MGNPAARHLFPGQLEAKVHAGIRSTAGEKLQREGGAGSALGEADRSLGTGVCRQYQANSKDSEWTSIGYVTKCFKIASSTFGFMKVSFFFFCII